MRRHILRGPKLRNRWTSELTIATRDEEIEGALLHPAYLAPFCTSLLRGQFLVSGDLPAGRLTKRGQMKIEMQAPPPLPRL